MSQVKADLIGIEIKEVVICTISMCTQRCWHCAHGVRIPPIQIMPENLVLTIIDDLAAHGYSKRLSFFCGNEPLLDPRLEDFFSYAEIRLPDVQKTLFSNGDLATLNVLERLFRSGMDKIDFSLHNYIREPKLLEYQDYFGKDKVVIFDHANPAIFEHFHNHGGLIKDKRVSQTKYLGSDCALPFKQMVVYPDYTLGLCCADMAKNVIIQIAEGQSVVEAFFQSAVLNNFRSMLAEKKRKMSPCIDCSYKGVDYFD